MEKYGNLWSMPDVARTTMTKKELQQFLQGHNGKILIHGRLRTIKSKHIGADVYEVWTEIKNREAPQVNSDVDRLESTIGEIRTTLDGLCNRVQAMEKSQLGEAADGS